MSTPPEKPPKPIKPIKPPKPASPIRFDAPNIASVNNTTPNSATNSVRSDASKESWKLDQRDKASTSGVEENENVKHQGILSKRNREGKFEKCLFTVYSDCISYHRLSAAGVPEAETPQGKNIPLTTVLIRELEDSDYEGCVKRERAFRFLSSHKSFLVRAKTLEEKHVWFTVLSNAAKECRTANIIEEPDNSSMAPIWVLDESSCQICKKQFTFFIRKHHCRNCGRCVCETCSKEKIKIPRLDERQLFKVCTECAKDLKNNRVYGVPTHDLS